MVYMFFANRWIHSLLLLPITRCQHGALSVLTIDCSRL